MSEQPEDNGPTVAEQTGGDDGAAINLADPNKPMTIAGLHEMLQQRNHPPVKEYVPPPRTERQMSQLEEELEAGRRRVAFNEAQQAARPPRPKAEVAAEGSTVPVMRPNDGAGTKEMDSKRLKSGV